MKKIISYLTIISLLLITFSCGGGGSSKGVSPVTVLASFKTSSAGSAAMKTQATTLTNIRYTVSGSDMDIMTGTVPVTGNLVEFTLNVPNGPQRHFVIEAIDTSNYVRYKGEAYRDLNGAPVIVEITLIEQILDISGSWILYLTPDGGVEESDCFFIEQYDKSVYFSWWQHEFVTSVSGTLAGSSLELLGESLYYGESIYFTALATTDGNTIIGTYNYSGAYSQSGAWRAEKGLCKKSKGWVRVCKYHGQSQYDLDFYVWDLIFDEIIIKSASVAGPNIGTLPLIINEQTSVYLGETMPIAGDIYTFNIEYSDGTTDTVTATVRDTFVGTPVPISPADGEIVNTLTPTFSWQPPPCNCQGYYRVWVVDSLGNDIWSVYPSKEATSVVYNFDGNGIPLKTGETYEWRLIAFDKPILGGPDNNVWAISSFTVQ